MIQAIQTVFYSINNFFTSAWIWLDEGVYNLAIWGFRQYIYYYTLSSLTLKLYIINFSWDVARSIVIDMQISQRLQGFWDLLPVDVSANASALRIPECILIIITAYITRYVMKFVPGGS